MSADHWDLAYSSVAFARRQAVGRVLVLLGMAAGALLLPLIPSAPDIAHRNVIVVALVCLAPIGLIASRFTGGAHARLVQVSIDHASALILAAAIPEVWPAAAVIISANTVWWLLRQPSRARNVVLVLSIAGLIAVGAATNAPGWMAAAICIVLLSVLFRSLTNQLKVEVGAVQTDLSEALAQSGSMVHAVSLSEKAFLRLRGPVREVTGWETDEWTTLDHRSLIHPDDLEEFWLEPDAVESGAVIDRKARFLRKDGTYEWLRDVSRVNHTADGTVTIRGFLRNIDSQEQAQQVIRRQAETDELTGLSNRGVLISELERRLETEEPFALVIFDLDRFKNINDTLGHGFGDLVLIETARRLRRIGRASDAIVRLGGDEFALIVANLRSDESAVILAERIAAECGRVMSLQDISISVSASIGVALAPRDGSDVQTLLRHADIAMYDAKRDGRSYRIFDQGIRHAPFEDVTLSASLAQALALDEFVLDFQPKVNLADGTVVGFEGLARWNHPTFGQLQPDRFVHLVTVSDHSRAFADRIIDLGVQFAARCRAAGRAVPVAVNISARSLFDDTLPERTAEALARHELPAELLIVEITEHDIMERTGRATNVLPRLAEIGVTISIDDFGTGYSSLARLADLPISEIKIDRRFVTRALQRVQDRVIVNSIADLAENLGLHLVAEGVESFDAASMLLHAGCDEAQGFLFSSPVHANTALELLSTTFPTPASFGSPALRSEAEEHQRSRDHHPAGTGRTSDASQGPGPDLAGNADPAGPATNGGEAAGDEQSPLQPFDATDLLPTEITDT